MIKINFLKTIEIIFFVFFILLFCSCNGQSNANFVCKKKFKEARDLVFTYPNPLRQSALDSALDLTNECLQCDSIRKAVVDFKITLLIEMKKYPEGIRFIDSLSESDFTYGFKKNLMSNTLRALNYISRNDTTQRDIVYKEMVNDLEKYLKMRNPSDKEFKEIYISIFAVKGNYLITSQTNNELDSLQKVYPDKQAFFNFLKAK